MKGAAREPNSRAAPLFSRSMFPRPDVEVCGTGTATLGRCHQDDKPRAGDGVARPVASGARPTRKVGPMGLSRFCPRRPAPMLLSGLLGLLAASSVAPRVQGAQQKAPPDYQALTDKYRKDHQCEAAPADATAL